MPSGSMWSKDNHLNEFKEYTYENICFYLTITWYAVSFKTKYLKSLGLFTLITAHAHIRKSISAYQTQNIRLLS